MTYYCADCDTHWAPYQARHGCPECGSGTTRTTNSAPDANAMDRHRAALAIRDASDESERRHSEFEAFYAEREIRLNGLDALPTTDPERRAA